MKRIALKHTEEWALLDLMERVDLGPERPVLSGLAKRIRGRAAVKRKAYGLDRHRGLTANPKQPSLMTDMNNGEVAFAPPFPRFPCPQVFR